MTIKLALPRLQWPGQQPRRPFLLPPKNRTSADKNCATGLVQLVTMPMMKSARANNDGIGIRIFVYT